MASKPSVHNTEKKSKKKYTFKKLTTFEDKIEISINNLGSDGWSSGNDNLPGCQKLIYLEHPKPLRTYLQTIAHRYVKDFLKHQRKIFLPLRKTDLKRALLNVLNGNTLVSGADPGGGGFLRYGRCWFIIIKLS